MQATWALPHGIGDNFIVVNVDPSKKIDYDLICLNDSVTNCFGELKNYKISSDKLNINEDSYKIFPNPASDYLNFTPGPILKNLRLQIFDLGTHCVFDETFHTDKQETISLQKINKGIYILVISGDEEQKTLKLIKN